MTRASATPSEPPNSISGPSRPIDMPVAIAVQDDSTRETVVRTDRCTWPGATTSMALPTPGVGVARRLTIRPAAAPPRAGRPARIHHGSPPIASTTSPAPRAVRYHRASELLNAIANAAAPIATRHSAVRKRRRPLTDWSQQRAVMDMDPVCNASLPRFECTAVALLPEPASRPEMIGHGAIWSERRPHRSMTTSPVSCEQHTRRLPSAGWSSGSGA